MVQVPESILKAVTKYVRASAVSNGGSCSWHFSQMYGKVAKTIGAHEVSEDGICEMLSAFYMERHKRCSSLETYVTPHGKPGGLDLSKIRQIMQLFIMGNTMSPNSMIGNDYWSTGSDQDLATRVWLKAKGLKERETFRASRGGGSRSGFGIKLGTELAKASSKAPYVLIGIHGPDSGHAMAVSFLKDVRFFDPNFGEFTFPTPGQFGSWFGILWGKFYGRKVLGANQSDSYEFFTYV
ncbi:MAG: hypothetical protein ACI841_001072 [Planctomycetota bacterium]|jgi:hypothetical protein